jgi:hypothetical protein
VHLIRSNAWSISSTEAARSSCPLTTKKNNSELNYDLPFRAR